MPRDIPIIFSAAMIRALRGGRKTQTRRVLRLPTKGEYVRPDMGGWVATTVGGGGSFRVTQDGSRVAVPEQVAIWNRTTGTTIVAPYQIGDRLWTRENAKLISVGPDTTRGVAYPADGADAEIVFLEKPKAAADMRLTKTTPSIHVPQWASRLTLLVAGVKIERLQDISEADALAEGVPFGEAFHPIAERLSEAEGKTYCPTCRGWGTHGALGANLGVTEVDCADCDTPQKLFRNLWRSINSDRIRVKVGEAYEWRDNPARWDANPWVIAPSFEVHKANIDSLARAA